MHATILRTSYILQKIQLYNLSLYIVHTGLDSSKKGAVEALCFLTYILGLVTHFFPFLLHYEIYEGLVV